MNTKASKYAPLLLLALMLVPLTQAITIDGPTNFENSHGGIVRYDFTAIVSQIGIVNTLTRFTNLRTGGINMGNLGFDCDTDVTMTITGITHNSISYTIETGLVPAVDSFVYYRRTVGTALTAPVTVTGGTWTYAGGILTVATTGASVPVVVTYGMDIASPMFAASALIWALFPFLILVLGIQDARAGTLGVDTLYKILFIGVMVAFMAWLVGTWGY